ncbi:glycogen debranching protein GlgX [Uliginosibacterium aquaticum]|uniref:Glycogen debranching protein GlgX n=1 Tax=Uliginosibacterium aquaticum TaxID=2731212 RepID=A0ABX2IDK2_9RHOO|nr:glycogen debranching protein GlgX [Uliginosibacterium aquaticum]NSL54679.1 glycogen debranching protein GlgX [Uliginosibacterium aquaticum]
MELHTLLPGKPWPLGAHADSGGVNFAVFSANATAVFLCLFDSDGQTELARLPLLGHTLDVWHGYLPEALPGLIYGLRCEGPWAPQEGHYFNPEKLLLDPYAREIVGQFNWNDAHFCAIPESHEQPCPEDNGRYALKARVPAPDGFDWGDDAPPEISPADTVIYELHVKGFSKSNPAIPEGLRGTYAGLAHPASLAHLKRLGVTALSILPVHYHLDELRLTQMGLVNYWGYNSINFFTPDPRYASGADGLSVRDEFRSMVRALHAAGIKVLLDVVYNHTAEGDATGPSISFRGLDNASYYRLDANNKRIFINDTGCGNTLDIRQPNVLRLVLDSLRYWVSEMHVDGFRFDLAPILGRDDSGFNPRAAFFAAVAQDPVLSRVTMIAEPWDIGPGGYQLGGFPRGWQEWNDRFRDTLRAFWLGHPCTRGDFAMRLCGSSDLFQANRREPLASVNYIVSHDGYTLRDLVSYVARRNQANGEDNRDGHNHNLSSNCGEEGPSTDPVVLALRTRMQRVLLASALFSQGTPMLSAGDELGHSQGGNNNPYCQDNPGTWIAWAKADQDLIAFTARLLSLRRQAMLFATHWYRRGPSDLVWLRKDGEALHSHEWRDAGARTLGCLINHPGRASVPLLLLVNAEPTDCHFALPAGEWRCWFDTTASTGERDWHGSSTTPFALGAHSMVLLAAGAAKLNL